MTAPDRPQDPSFAQGAAGTEAARRNAERVATLGLERNAAELDEQGYTIVPDAAPPELFAAIRDAIVEVTDEHRARGVEPFNFGPRTSMVYRLLARHPVFADAVLAPKLDALVTHLLGDGYVAQVITGSILEPGSRHGPLHSDNQFFPDPFPPQAQFATAIWCCDPFTDELGSTHLVPGSHRAGRHPRPGEAADETIPVVADAGSIVLWSGHTWHRSGSRRSPGQRVALHTGFSRPHIRTFEAYRPEEAAPLVARDPRFVRLLGLDLPYDSVEDSPDPEKLYALALTTQAQA